MNTLIINGHPNYDQSNLNKKIVEWISQEQKVDVINIKELYPDFKINVKIEQERLLKYDKIILQFPIYWYSTPAIIKQYIDDVFAYGYAHGTEYKLEGKEIVLSSTTPSPQNAYKIDGLKEMTIEQMFLPIVKTFEYMKLNYRGAIVLFDADKTSFDDYKIIFKKTVS